MVAADLAAARAAMRAHDQPFYVASRILPPRVRDPATAIYAFCESLTAMVADRDPPPSAADELRERIRAACGGQPRAAAVDRAFARVVADHAVPDVVFEAFAEGLSWDAAGRRYATDSGLFDYCVRVGGTVAAATCLLTGRRKPVVIERAFDLGVAMLLTKIARDVGHDARRGRLYLPLEWLEDAGVDVDSMMEARVATPAIRGVVRRVLQTADSFYLRADPGIAALPFDCRPAIRGIRYIYAGLGHEIEQYDCDSVTHRAAVPLVQTLRLLGRALRPSRSESRPLKAQPMRQAEALVTAVASAL